MTSSTEFWILVGAGLAAGLIDSVAGGGGLVTVPVFTLLIGPGSTAIGTNKVAGALAALFALLVYAHGGHVTLKGYWRFAVFTGVGSVLGAFTSPLIPPEFYRWLLVAILPVMLWIVYQKELWVAAESSPHALHQPPAWQMIALGLGCGFYDGIAGPGGGTLMFLSLFLVAKIPLLNAMAAAKIANLTSASLSLLSYAATGHVVWAKGLTMAVPISLAAAVGARLATKNASGLARAALLVLSTLLVIKLVLS